MPPIEVGSTQRPGAIESRLARVNTAAVPGATTTSAPAASTQISATPSVETSQALSAGEAPVDTDRVALIRKAVESGTYPVLPAKIADAMIAAGMLLRTAR
ncbi:flagellar biosynthesis anti-sigma factor FlgM [Novosphingobium sp. Leaf2]|uniref:flagellar biosynthesis anti-sigma factor FlgM n=1 Tax=Novosphingobium sp. Leaf2 TaxID=1735670 RepID=UPI0006FEFEC6|nr:flagellar biosynthesis anti-sigma factor FlgM [Novosphingobium sp. Leaf2]KQM14805.1 flagellar biosynthesis protein FlgM [Novosphingobium sp. Leaf2]